jgi:hypothetical protein
MNPAARQMVADEPRGLSPRGDAASSSMPRTLLIFGSLAVLIAAAVVEGTLSNRWGSEDLKAAAAKLKAVPPAFGAWTSTENPIREEILKKAEAIGSISRDYENGNNHHRVSVLLLCGPAGPIGAHTPDICYAGLGYTMNGREIRNTVAVPGGPEATYWSGRFEKPNGDSSLVVSWTWSVDGNWVAAEKPRVEFIGHKGLYKLYVTRSPTQAERDNAPAGADPTQEFLSEFLPEVKKALAR